LPDVPSESRRCRAIVTVSVMTVHRKDLEGIRVMGA
jgi:hypothetical protein